jgi:hypothetical protein
VADAHVREYLIAKLRAYRAQPRRELEVAVAGPLGQDPEQAAEVGTDSTDGTGELTVALGG